MAARKHAKLYIDQCVCTKVCHKTNPASTACTKQYHSRQLLALTERHHSTYRQQSYATSCTCCCEGCLARRTSIHASTSGYPAFAAPTQHQAFQATAKAVVAKASTWTATSTSVLPQQSCSTWYYTHPFHTNPKPTPSIKASTKLVGSTKPVVQGQNCWQTHGDTDAAG